MGSEARAGMSAGAGAGAGAGRLVYNMYRDMLKNYNERANEILETKPAGCVSEDRGVADLVHSMARQLSSGQQMSSETSSNGGLPAPPPPPPPPPLGLGAVPAVRLKSEIGERREPPACVQNAMMTKDKKPFTYTPGGLDLSQIRSPRMARRLTRNAMSEGVLPQTVPPQVSPPVGTGPQLQEGGAPPPPPPPMMMAPVRPQVLPTQPPPVLPMQQPKTMPVPSSLAQPPKAVPVQSSLAQPPKAVPVQSPLAQPPKAVPVQSPLAQPSKSPPVQQPPRAVAVQSAPAAPPPPVQQSAREPVKLQQPRQPVVSQPPTPTLNQPREPASPPLQREVVIVTQPVVREAPGPRAAMPVQVVQSPPPTPPSAGATVPDGHMRRPVNEPRSQVGSIYVPPLSPEEVAQKSGSSTPATPATALNKAPTPWLTGRGAQQRSDAPSWARATPPSAAPPERIIPVQIEYTSTPASAPQQQAQQQQQQQQQRPHLQMQRQPSMPQQQQQQQQQFYQQQQQQQQFYQQQQQQQQQQQRQREHVVRVIPIQIEGRRPAGNDNGSESPATSGPVQSPAFRVLERVTSRDEELHSQPAVEHPPTVGHAFYKEQQAQARRDQREPEPRKYTGASIPSRSFQMLQAMVAPENCAADGTRADDHSGGDCPGSASDAATHPCPVPPWGHEALAYWPDPYWAYMHAPAPGDGGGDSAPPDPGFWYAPPPPPPWDPYMAAAYWYGYWPPCTPHPTYTSASDTDDYSSTDEMGRYGLGWPQPPPLPPQQQSPPAVGAVTDTDAELERAGLQAIRSVSDIQVYKEASGLLPGRRTATDIERSTSASSASSSPSLSEDSSDDDDDDDEEFEVSECPTEDGMHVPHQLSIIFEESEASDVDRRKRELSVATTVSEDDSEATVAVHTADTDNEEPLDDWDGTCETTVTVRLPLKLKFGKSVNGANDVTEVVVGDSEVRSGGAPSPRTFTPHLRRQRSDDTVENYETAESDTDTLATERKVPESSRTRRAQHNDEEDVDNVVSDVDGGSDDESIDGHMAGMSRTNGNNDDANAEQEDNDSEEYDDNESNDDADNNANEVKQEADAVSSTEDKRNNSKNSLNEINCEEDKDENANETAKLIHNLIINETRSCVEADTTHVSVRQRVKAIEGQSSLECTGDEDIDSGVTSDVSRHTDTETECASEVLRNRYQRAATHSRLFKLLQDECSKSDDEEQDEEEDENENEDEDKDMGRDGHDKGVDAAAVRESARVTKKQQMWLPLSGSDPESFSSSGVCSPASPTWAARELVRGPAHEDALSNTSEDGSPLDSCYSSDYRSYFGSWERAAARARCPRVREAPARAAAPSPAPRRQAAGAS